MRGDEPLAPGLRAELRALATEGRWARARASFEAPGDVAPGPLWGSFGVLARALHPDRPPPQSVLWAHGSPGDCVVLCAPEHADLSTTHMRELEALMADAGLRHAILVSNPTWYAEREIARMLADGVRVEVFKPERAQRNVLRHHMQPGELHVLDEAQVALVCERYECRPHELHVVFETDPLARALGLVEGAVLMTLDGAYPHFARVAAPPVEKRQKEKKGGIGAATMEKGE